jgi:hypothetical protein
MNFIYSQFFISKIFISGGFSSVLILAYNHTQFEDQENMRENIKSRVYHSHAFSFHQFIVLASLVQREMITLAKLHKFIIKIFRTVLSDS